MIIIIQIDGGGGKIVIPMTVLAGTENRLDVRLVHKTDLACGASAGGICAGVLASGRVSMQDAAENTYASVKSGFRRRMRWPIIQPKYDRNEFLDPIEKLVGPIRLNQMKTRCMITSVLVNDKPHHGPWQHFFKSWEEADGQLELRRALARSFAAPYYFGYLNEPDTRQTWADGGCGLDNCTLDFVWGEIVRQEWLYERVHVLSIGCGWSDKYQPYKVTRKWKNVRQVLSFGDVAGGGMARGQSIQNQVEDFERDIKPFPGITFQRVDINLRPELDVMDGGKYVEEYKAIGKMLAETVDLSPFMDK